jgi:hypothetical protein
MKKLLYFIILITSVAYNGCSYIKEYFSKPEILIRKDFNGEGMAVLTFSQSGYTLPTDIGKKAADKLTDAFFLINKFSVIDRAKTNEAQAEIDIPNTEYVSADKLQQIGLKLKANYLILGRIDIKSEKEYLSIAADQELRLSFRIISVANTDVIGVANYSGRVDDGNIPEELDKIILKIVNEIKNQRE